MKIDLLDPLVVGLGILRVFFGARSRGSDKISIASLKFLHRNLLS